MYEGAGCASFIPISFRCIAPLSSISRWCASPGVSAASAHFVLLFLALFMTEFSDVDSRWQRHPSPLHISGVHVHCASTSAVFVPGCADQWKQLVCGPLVIYVKRRCGLTFFRALQKFSIIIIIITCDLQNPTQVLLSGVNMVNDGRLNMSYCLEELATIHQVDIFKSQLKHPFGLSVDH